MRTKQMKIKKGETMKEQSTFRIVLYGILITVLCNNSIINPRYRGAGYGENNVNMKPQDPQQPQQQTQAYIPGQTPPWLQYMDIQNPSGTLIISAVSTMTGSIGSTAGTTGSKSVVTAGGSVTTLPTVSSTSFTQQDYTQAQSIVTSLNVNLERIGNGSFNPDAFILLVAKYLLPLITQATPTLTLAGIQQAVAAWANDSFIDTISNNYFNTPGKTYGVSTYVAGTYLMSIAQNQMIPANSNINVIAASVSQNACVIFFQELLNAYNQYYATSPYNWATMFLSNGISIPGN